MSLQRRLLLSLLLCAPVVWGAALYASINRARHEVNELYDTELVRLARQVHSTFDPAKLGNMAPLPAESTRNAGESDMRDLRLGERFYRPEGQAEFGSGLGVSIALRIAELHGLAMTFGVRENGRGVKVTLAHKDAAAEPLTGRT